MTGSSAPNGSSISISPRRGRQRARDADALALPAGQLASGTGAPLRPRGRPTRSSSSSTRSCAGPCRLPAAARSPMFSATRHMREQPDILEHIADPPPQPVRIVGSHVVAVDQHPPDVGSISRLTVLSRVDLPEPELPTSATKLPAATVQDTSSTARTDPNRFDTCSNTICPTAHSYSVRAELVEALLFASTEPTERGAWNAKRSSLPAAAPASGVRPQGCSPSGAGSSVWAT